MQLQHLEEEEITASLYYNFPLTVRVEIILIKRVGNGRDLERIQISF